MKILFFVIDTTAILLAGYFSIQTAAVDQYWVLAAGALLAAWQVLENGYLRRRFGGTTLPAYPGGLARCMAAFAAVLSVSVLDRLTGSASASVAWGLAGIGLCVAGIVLRLSAFVTLGTDFLRPPIANQRPVRTGPYRFLKHPAGLGLLLLGLGAALAWGSIWGLVAVSVLLLPSLLYVHRVEERARGLFAGRLTFSQRFLGHPLTVPLYESFIHPLFLFLFSRFFRFESIYQKLRELGDGGEGRTDLRVLDMACGTCWFGRRILRENRNSTSVVGVDLSTRMLAQARRIAQREGIGPKRLQLLQEDVHDLQSFDTHSFDEVWLCGALHQIPDPARALREAARVLRPGGSLYCQTLVESLHGWTRRLLGFMNRGGFSFLSRGALAKTLRAAGFFVRGETTSGRMLLFRAVPVENQAQAQPRQVLVLGGTGCTGQLIVRDLLRHHPEYRVDVGARHPEGATDLPLSVGRVHINLRDEAETVRTLSVYDLVILAVGPFEALGNRAHRLCIEAGVACLDINDSLPAAQAVFQLAELAETRDVLVLTGMGLSPGLTTLLALGALGRAAPGAKRLRSRLFIAGNQDAGRSAIRAMLSSFTRQAPEIRQGVFLEVPADDQSPESRYRFPSTIDSVRAWHYPTPEAWTLPRFRGSAIREITQMDYRVHFQGIPSPLVWALRTFPFLREGLPAVVLSRIIHVIHDGLKRWKDTGLIAVAECEDAEQTVRAVAHAPTSYEATARFATAMAELVLARRLAVESGVHALETALPGDSALRELLHERDIHLSYLVSDRYPLPATDGTAARAARSATIYGQLSS
jgi:ubiquinone/menaquinone biosynthesis C-methylase UbiE/protein-S-isoprenylcysteine O-methyltransferase Ste14